MPIKIPDELPARLKLEAEGIPVMGVSDADRQDIRPLRIGLLNLMPNKIQTETQIARLLGASPLQVELSLIRITDHVSRNTPREHLSAFYRSWSDAKPNCFDGLIITGAPLETIPFEAVSYWSELCTIFDWARTNVHRTLTICWAAQAALYHSYGIPKHAVSPKISGLYHHKLSHVASPYVRGFSDEFLVPVSRRSETLAADIPPNIGLKILARSKEAGLCLIEDPARRTLHMFNHLEYDRETLRDEYERDLAIDGRTSKPRQYFPNDDPSLLPPNSWRSHANLLFANWINEIYRTTPFRVEDIPIGAG